MANSKDSDSMQVHELGDTLRISFPAVVDLGVAQKFSADCNSWLLKPLQSISFDFAATTEMKVPAYRAFVNFHQLIAKTEIKLGSQNLKADLLKQIRQDGLMNVFNPVASQGAGKPASKNPFDLVLANALCKATQKTLEVTAQTKVTILKPKLVKMDEKDTMNISVAGILNLSTDNFHGSMTIAFTSETFLKIYERMIGETHTVITAEIEDAAGEILNIIYGTAKSELNQLPGYNLQPSLPTILSGEKLKVRQRTNMLIVQLPFETDLGTFYVEIAVEMKSEKAVA